MPQLIFNIVTKLLKSTNVLKNKNAFAILLESTGVLITS
jgi:hypothetical protein